MTFLVGELASEIRLEGKEQYARDLDRMGMLTGGLASDTSKLTNAMRTGFQAASNVVGTAAIAGTALGVSLLKTGAAYNTLQQTSRAALSTLLGGAEAANAQMDKLDEFARTSPFSKGVFIQAQQQLLGFGMEAGKVLPTLDAIQNAVAATGGSSQQLSEITYVLAQIQAAGKITATDLMQLGQRGIDAATLIGSQMGKTGAQIREDITDGALDAQTALDALAAGMQARYGGAADNVKNTILGATDRIKAATREIGAALAEPFIGQQGGGLAVEWGNQVADVLQGVRAHAQPVVSLLVGGLQPAFNGMSASLDRANIVVRSWDSSLLEQFLRRSGDYVPGVAALGGALVGMSSGALRSLPVVGQLIPRLNPLAGALIAVAVASPEVRSGALEVLDSFRPLIPIAGELTTILASGLSVAAPIAGQGLELLAAIARPVVGILDAIPTPVLAAVGAFLAMRAAAGPLAPVLQTTFESLQRFGEMAAVQQSLARMEGNTSAFAGTMGVAGKAARGLGDNLKAAFVSNPVGLVLLGVSTAVALLTAAFAAQAQEAAEVKERVQGYRDTLRETTGSLTDATRAQLEKNLMDGNTLSNLDKLGIKKETYIRAILGEADAQTAVNKALEESRRIAALPSNERSWSELLNDEYKAGSQLIGVYDEQRSALTGAAQAAREDARAKREADAAAGEAARSNQRLNDALSIARDITRDATERVNALKQALDELNGGTKTQADLTRDLNEQTNRLRDVFLATDEAGNRLAPSLVNAAGAIDTTTAAGIALYDETKRLNDQMLDAIIREDELAKKRGETGISTEAAAAAAQPYIDRLREIAYESGMSDEQVNGLVTTMMSTPEVVAFLVDDNGTIDEKQQALLALAQEIIATPDGHFQVESESFPGLMAALEALGVKTTTLPDGTVQVHKDDGSFATVERSLDNLARTRTVQLNAAFSQYMGWGGGPQYGPLKPPGSANGNLFNRGRVQSFANGGFPTGIFTGGLPMYKFAEPETGWEAFISGRKGQEARNLAIASDAVSRLGGMVVTPHQLRQARSESSGGSRIDRSLHLSVQAAPGTAVPPIHEVMRLVRRLEASQARKA